MAAPDLDGVRQLAVRDPGRPVGILFARRDFLSAFMTCFLPIIVIYYPLMLFGTNLSKEGHARADCVALDRQRAPGRLAGFVLPSVVKH